MLVTFDLALIPLVIRSHSVKMSCLQTKKQKQKKGQENICWNVAEKDVFEQDKVK